MKENIKKQYPFQYYTIRNVDLLEQNGFSFDNYSFNIRHSHELYIGNINGLICRHSYGLPIKMLEYLVAGEDKKLTFLLPENYRECVNDLRGLRKSVTDYFDAEQLKDRITVITYKVDNSDIIDKVTELGKSMKFDCAMMNPPYDKSLHLKILEKVLKFCDKVVNISPIRWLQDPFAQEKHSELRRFENSICKKMHDVKIVKNEEASKLFNIMVYSDLGIYISGLGFDYKNFWKKTRSDTEISILNKVCNSDVTKLSVVIENNKKDGVRTLITGIAGNRGTKPIYKELNYVIDGKLNGIDWTKLKNMGGYEKPENSPLPASIEFSSTIEAENFYNSYNTKLLTYICKISCQQQNIQLQKLPFMQDYTQPWTDERLCKFFDITGYIDDDHAESGSEWELILKYMSN